VECCCGVCPMSDLDQNASDAQKNMEEPMHTIETSIDIQRPVEAVFAYVADPRNGPQWQGAIKEAHVTPEGQPMVGTKVTQVVSFLGVKLEPTGEITALEPNRSFSFKGRSGPAMLEATYRFEAVGTGTRLSATVQVEPGGLFQLAGPLFASQFKKQNEADFQRLKDLLEAQRA
jgi:uncharacterized membrane protein